MAKNSKRIGGEYEREISRVLSKWLSGKDDPLVVWRTPHSGSISTIAKNKGKSGSNTEGDFQCLDLTYQFFFDLFCADSKCYKECNPYFINTKNMKSNTILNQWIKVCGEAGNKIPLMIVKVRDRKSPEFVCIPSYVKYDFSDICDTMNYSFIDTKILDFTVILLEEFVSKINAKELCTLNKKENTK